MPDGEARRAHVRLVVAEHEADALMLGEHRAEGLALARVLGGDPVRGGVGDRSWSISSRLGGEDSSEVGKAGATAKEM